MGQPSIFIKGNLHRAEEVTNLGALNTYELVGHKAKLRANTTLDTCIAELQDVNRAVLGGKN